MVKAHVTENQGGERVGKCEGDEESHGRKPWRREHNMCSLQRIRLRRQPWPKGRTMVEHP